MLEGLVANLLNRFLGIYVQNFDPKQLNVGIWSGDVKLRDLELRREALDQLRLPLIVVEGHLGQLTLQIPWSNLRGKPVRVEIEDVFLLAAPKEDADYDVEEEERRQHNLKMEKLDSAELIKERNTEGMNEEEVQKNQSFTASLVTAIVDNVQVSVKNIHIRYEDAISDPGHPFALGVTLQEFSAISTDSQWKPTFIQSTSGSSHKMATLGSLAVYWNTDANLMGSGKGTQVGSSEQGLDHAKFISDLRDMITTSDTLETSSHQFVLKPVSGKAGIELDKTGKSDRPKLKARLLFDELGFIVDDNQYRDALMLVDLFHYFIRHQESKKFRPKSRPKEDPRAWLEFAGKVVLDKIHQRNRRWSWDYLKERRDDRIAYIDLFKKKKREETLSTEQTASLDKLERKLTYEDLRFWRSLARNQLRKENVGVKKPPQKQTWTAWAFGGGKSSEETSPEMSEEQRKQLYDAIDYDDRKAISDAVDMPRDYVRMQAEMSLRTGSFTLKRDPHGKGAEILKFTFDSFSTKALQRTDSLYTEFRLDSMKLYDGTTENSLFPEIITIKDAPAVADKPRVQELDGLDGSDDQGENDAKEDPFFFLSFENNPLDGSADTAVTAKLKAMEIMYNPVFLVEVAKFFKPPERHMESIGALMESAGATVEEIRQQTRAGLEFALEEHKTINAQLDLQAPLIIMPNSVTEDSSICLIVDAGHASVSSDLVDKKTLKDVQSKQNQKFSDEDYKRLEGLMYDKFHLKLESTQVLIGRTIEETRAQLEGKTLSNNMHLIERINMDFEIAICIIPRSTELTRFKISGRLPVLHASMSDAKYRNLMELIEVAVPKFGDQSEKQLTDDVSGDRAPQRAAKRDRPESFQFSAQEHALIIDEDGDEDQKQKFKQAPEGDNSSLLRRRNFEFNFNVDKLQGSLFRADSTGKGQDELLVELVAEGFDLQFYQRRYDMAAIVSLRSLVVDDHVDENPSPDFKSIISSGETSSTDSSKLFNLVFTKVDKDSPEYQSKYEGIATNLDVDVSTINVIATRKTLLTLLDFVLITFTKPQGQGQKLQQIENEKDTQLTQSAAVDKIRIKAHLESINIILNNDGIRLATLSLNVADVAIFLKGKSMRIGARLGDLTLIDDINEGVPHDSPIRKLVSIQGKELADFRYETFDEDSEGYPGYDSNIFLRSGSIKVNFLTEPFRKIMDFLVKFGKMQAFFNAARQAAANQASQMQERANKIRFDIQMSTPIVVFPRITTGAKPRGDTLTANLGEIYLNNQFVPLDDSKDSSVSNKIAAGVRKIRLTSNLNLAGDQMEQLDLIDQVDVDFNVTYVEHQRNSKRPDLEIDGNMSDISMKLTEEQLRFMLELSKSVPAAFATEPGESIEEDVVQELPRSMTDPAQNEMQKKEENSELESESIWTKLDLVFKVQSIGLDLLYRKDNKPITDTSSAGLSKFALNQTSVKLRIDSNNALESELLVQSLAITDTRSHETNKFRKVMSLINTDVKQQFMANVSISGSEEKHMIVLLTVDSPKMILAVEYLFMLQSFVSAGLQPEDSLTISSGSDSDTEATEDESVTSDDSTAFAEPKPTQSSNSTNASSSGDGMTISVRVNIADAQVILIANPAIASSEAVVLGTKQVLLSKQRVTTVQVDKVGMFLCRMDKFDSSRLRILDDFSIQTSMDVRNDGPDSNLTNIVVDIEPLVVRVSLRDILLAMQVFTKASEMTSRGEVERNDRGEPEKLKQLKASSNNPRSHGPASTAAKSAAPSALANRGPSDGRLDPTQTVMNREEMRVDLSGLRVVIIGDAHELPMLDWSVKGFSVEVRDWSGAMTADTNIDMFLNVYNFSKSAWEPLIEPWQFGFHMAKNQNPQRMSLDLYSRKSLEVTVTAATIGLATQSAQFLSTDEDVLSKPRGLESPYRIRNHTGFDLNVWAENQSEEGGIAAKLTDGEEEPWRFEDPTTTRETLSPEGASGVVGVKLESSGFESVNRVSLNREGEALYNLKPKRDGIQHRLLVEVKLGDDNVKYVTFRSPLLVENNTQIPVEVGVYSPEDGHLLKIERVAPGDARPAPVGAAYHHSLIVRPDQGFGYGWTRERLFWKDLLRQPIRTISCKGEQDKTAPPFYFQMQSKFDPKDPLTKVYPYMRIRLAAPVEVQNLLPYDFKYRIYDEHTKKDWTNFLRKGGVSPVHVVDLSHLLLLSIDLQDTPFQPSKFAVINSSDRDGYRRENTLEIRDRKNQTLRIKLHYYSIPDSGGAFKLTIYSPYVILNRTGLDLDIKSKAFMSSANTAAGLIDDQGESRKAPLMFAFPSDDRKNRALIKIGSSSWSKPQSFDAIGSAYDVRLPSSTNKSEMSVGVSVEEGEGKYNLCKVVTIAPRFILSNKMDEDINVREPGSSDILTLKKGELRAIRFLNQTFAQGLCLCFPGVNNQWSSPFHISNVGTAHVKLAKAGQRQKLIKVDILMEKATLFLHISVETRHWPFSMRNESSTEFLFFQSNPNIDEDEEDRSSGWKPIRYRLPPRSIMPYAWDYPAAKNKEIILVSSGRERHVKLAEIGNLLPMKLPATQESRRNRIIDINVAADGPTQTMVLSDYKQSKSLYRQKTSSSMESSSTGFEVKEQDTDVTLKAQLRFAGIGLSLINSQLREMVYVTLRDIELKYSDSALYQTLNSTVKWIQIDNQLYGGIFPILLYPSVVPKTGKEMEAHPIFHSMVTRVKDDSYGVLYIKYFTVLLQQMTLEIDEDFIFALLDFAKSTGSTSSEGQQGKLCDGDLDLPEPTQETQGRDVYFELLHLQPMQIDFSFVRTERINAEDTMSSNNPFMFAVNVLTMSLGNVNDAPVRYNALMLENARVSVAALMNNIRSHYQQESLRQIHVVLGSADFLGNPVGLFNNVSSGVADIFYEPYQGLVMTDRPQELGIGIAKGATSFVKKSVFGFSDSMAKITGSMSKGLAAATLDKEFQDRRRMSRARNRPKHALYGITSGGNAFASSMASGIGGLARHPLEGAEKEGAAGFVKGVGKAFLGLPTKAAVGAFDLASNMAEGVRNTTTVFDQEGLDRVRLSRFIGLDGIVRPYSQREALGQFWLKTLDNGKQFNEDYLAHLELPGKDMLVLLTYNGIMMVRTKNLKTEWMVPLKDIQTISKERTGMSITLKGGNNGPFIPVQDEGSRNWLYRQVAIAVNAYNDKYNAKG